MKFSIVVPVYNTEPAYFHQCMESILGQDYRGRYEVILIDDGSTTDIGRICDEYGRRDPRVVVVHQENRGVSEARNQGICRASGEWLYFVDPDDWIQTDTLKSAAEQLEQHQLDILCVAYQEEYGQESISYGYGWSESAASHNPAHCTCRHTAACPAPLVRCAPSFTGRISWEKGI